jgi:hypothetical protein
MGNKSCIPLSAYQRMEERATKITAMKAGRITVVEG